MNRIIIFAVIVFSASICRAQDKNTAINLLIRGDDIGSCHAANVACIEAYQNGIVQSTELMVCCPWFLEAVSMLKENPDLDVGIHLTLTSEWSNYKWKPITDAQSLVDSNGYFYPMVWQQDHFPPNTSIEKSDWNIQEIEQELSAQIELALAHLPNISHLTTHMGFGRFDQRIFDVVKRLGGKYKLAFDMEKHNIQRFKGWENAETLNQRIDKFCENLENLTPGTYIFIEHPGKDTPEMKSIYHKGYENVAQDRDIVTKVFTHKKVKRTILEKGINLVGYNDLKN